MLVSDLLGLTKNFHSFTNFSIFSLEKTEIFCLLNE